MFKCTLKINVCDTDTFSGSLERGLIYFFFLIRLAIADAHQNSTLADLSLLLSPQAAPCLSWDTVTGSQLDWAHLLFFPILILSVACTHPKQPSNYVTYPLALCDSNEIIALWLHIDFPFLLWDSHAAGIHALHKWNLRKENANLHLEQNNLCSRTF